ncbi:50S ribosomal protein P1 [Candidatus Pacearchaeota archaeon]|jgi:large subunit ribosomal protein L12|nr:50S ribosomal protein P1 [Candidatus Pacearchaeota archaeon]|tara:strand:- start:3175 stop:3471 length:297 start_codon:yes stop_codon:yes gene_type:complete
MEYTYAALLLHKLGKEVNVENVKSVVAAAGGETDESKIKSLVASLKGVDIAKELESVSLVAAAPANGSESSKAPEKKEEKPKEEKKEAAAEGLSALFG